ncbi:MAG: hypothetical protein P4L77_10915 [Sulfuriferula sp.]|nr:hypothetical protein [Sulfuriferula sp.]
MAKSNVWIDILLGRIGEFYMRALEEAEYFDFMTLFRRLLADKTLMNFKLMIEKGNDVFESPDVSLKEMSDTIGKMSPKINKAFEKISNVVSVEDMRNSNYILRESGEYSFMEVWWTFLVWVSLGDDGVIPIESFVLMVKDFRQAITAGEFGPLDAIHKATFHLSGESAEVKRDLFQLMYQRLDQKLLAIKEKSFNGTKRIQEVIEQDLIYSH